MSDIGPENLYLVFEVRPGSGEPERRLLGKFVLDPDGITVLENHGLRQDLETMTPEDCSRYIHSLSRGMYTEVVCLGDILDGHRPDLIPESGANDSNALKQLMAPADDGVSFEYVRQGHGPQELVVDGGRVYLDGHVLTDAETNRIQETVRQGLASVRHVQPLNKSEPGADVSQHIHGDTMVAGAGNHLAYKNSLLEPGGIHVHINGNGISDINKTHGLGAGNQAVAGIGAAIRASADESLGRKKVKFFRSGGDQFVLRVPDFGAAAQLSRNLRAKLKQIPALRGTHPLSVSIGFGHDSETAESALQDAKAAGHGQGRTSIASRVPGHVAVFAAD